MSYYNNIMVIYELGGKLASRMAGQMLPSGVIVLAIANKNSGEITEVINSVEPETIMEFVSKEFREAWELTKHYSEDNDPYSEPEWEYFLS